MDVHIGKISNSTLLCQYFIYIYIYIYAHTHTYYKLKSTQIYYFFLNEGKFYYNPHIKMYTQINYEFNNYKQYKFLNITKKNLELQLM